MLAGSGDSHVGQSSFLLQLCGIGKGLLVREQAVLETGEEHGVEFQPLGRVQGHEGDDAIPFGRDLIGIGDQADLLQEGRQGIVTVKDEIIHITSSGVLIGHVGSVGPRNEFLGHRDQLDEVLQTSLVLGILGVLQLDGVAGLLEDRGSDLVCSCSLIHHRPMSGHELSERSDLVCGTGGQAVDLVHPLDGLTERDATGSGEEFQSSFGTSSDTSSGNVEDATYRDVVGFVGNGPQVRDGVSHLLAFVEPHSANHAVGQTGADEHVLQGAGLGVGAVEHRDLTIAGTSLVNEIVDASGDPGSLVMLGVGNVPSDRRTVTLVGPQVLRRTSGVLLDEGVRSRENVLGGAIVLLQENRSGPWKILLEIKNVTNRGTAKCIDRLVRVAHHHEFGGSHLTPRILLRPTGVLRFIGTQGTNHLVLGGVGVLVLVDEDVPEAASVMFPHLGELTQQDDRLHDEIVEVECIGIVETTLILRIE